ncbi:MAG: hypothetical protein AAFY28_20520 [Actinomycetota bacterium]
MPEPAPQITAPAACAGVDGTFDVLISSDLREISRAGPVTTTQGVAASTVIDEAVHGDFVIWSFTPDSPSPGCTTVRNDRVIVVEPIDLAVEPTEPVGPIDVGWHRDQPNSPLHPRGRRCGTAPPAAWANRRQPRPTHFRTGGP